MIESYLIIQVKGTVQGVGFRYFTYQKALALGLTGYVRNLANGDVEIIVGGETEAKQQLITWLKQGGPRSARIADFTVQPFTPQEKIKSFSVKR